MVDINQYQENVLGYNDYPKEIGPYYSVMGIMSVTGTMAEKILTLLNTKDGSIDRRYATKLAISLGDIMRYVASLASDLNMSMEEVIAINLKKLELERQKKVEESKKVISENELKS